MTIKLRDYQEQCLTALAAHRAEVPAETRLAVVMATGLGKTITFAAEADRRLRAEEAATGGVRAVLILVHTDELAQQAEAKVRLVVGDRWTVGVVKAERNEVQADVVIGSVQTLANPARRAQLTDVGRIIVDECHHAVAPAYRAILEHYGAFAREAQPSELCLYRDDLCEHGACCRLAPPAVTVTGYTATLERGDGQGLGEIWQDVAFTRDISWAVRKGFLVPPRAYRVEIPELDLPAALGAALVDGAMVDSIAPERVVDAWIEHAKGRSTVLFAPLVRSAVAFARAFEERGFTSAVISGDMPTVERRWKLAAYNRGDVQVLCNAMVLTEGWDAPRTECVIVGRPTKSRPLFIQMAGRGLRPWLESDQPRTEQDCVLLVVADATTELASIADLSDRKGLQQEDGKSLLALEDEFDLSRGLAPDPERHWAGTVNVVEFDPLVARSSKVWSKTRGGTLFVPRGQGAYVFIAETPHDGLAILDAWTGAGRWIERNVPDLELAMSLAEDWATEHGGDFGRLIADKGRAWRKGKPSEEQMELARRLGLGSEVDRIMAAKAGGKAGKVSDLINRVLASNRIDPLVARIKGAK